MVIRFFVSGVPKSMSVGSSFRFKKNGVDTHIQGRLNTEWATLVGQIGRAHAPASPMTGPITMSVTFYLPRPQALAKKLAALPTKRPDIDNLIHKISDQWNGVFYADDAQVVDLIARKRYADPGAQTGVEIVVEEIFADRVRCELVGAGAR